MTTELGRLCVWLTCITLAGFMFAAVSCAGANKLRHGDSIDVSSYPKDIQEAYEVFAVRCSRCHTLARPLNARIHDPQHWVRYVARMRRNPTSGISEKNADVILRFLLYYMHQRDAEESRNDESEATPEAPVPSTASSAQPAAPAAATPAATERSPNNSPAPSHVAHVAHVAHDASPVVNPNATPAASDATQPQTPSDVPQRSP